MYILLLLLLRPTFFWIKFESDHFFLNRFRFESDQDAFFWIGSGLNRIKFEPDQFCFEPDQVWIGSEFFWIGSDLNRITFLSRGIWSTRWHLSRCGLLKCKSRKWRIILFNWSLRTIDIGWLSSEGRNFRPRHVMRSKITHEHNYAIFASIGLPQYTTYNMLALGPWPLAFGPSFLVRVLTFLGFLRK
jgi:hypothetical protein